jgi:hypothetical protein
MPEDAQSIQSGEIALRRTNCRFGLIADIGKRGLQAGFCSRAIRAMLAQSHVAPEHPMRNKRALWMTLLVYAFGGPLVGLLSVTVIGFVVQAWGPIIDRLEALIPHAQTSSCGPYSEHFHLRCFQLPPDLRQFSFPRFLQEPSVSVLFALIIGFVPALLAGFLICAGRLRDGGAGFSYAVLVGTLVGLVTGVMAIKSPEAAIGLFFVCLIATLVCWLVTERWWRKAATAGTNSAA